MRLVNHRFLAPIAAAAAFLGLASIGPATAMDSIYYQRPTPVEILTGTSATPMPPAP